VTHSVHDACHDAEEWKPNSAYVSVQTNDDQVEDGGGARQHVHAQPDEAQLAARHHQRRNITTTLQ
jgi:hypothetical protein